MPKLRNIMLGISVEQSLRERCVCLWNAWAEEGGIEGGLGEGGMEEARG